MNKIYSRPRIRLPKISFNGKYPKRPLQEKNKRKCVTIIAIMIIAIFTVKLILDAVYPIFDTECKDKARSIATMVSNKQATEVMKKHSYDELFTVERDSNGDISMIKSNVVPINEIISDIPNKIQQEINELGKDDVYIALGSFTGIRLLAGRGPNVKIKISSAGNVLTDLKSEFVSQGVNQTLHRVYLQVTCQVNILTPFYDMNETINNQVLLLENVFIGHVPDTFYDLDGLQESDALEVME